MKLAFYGPLGDAIAPELTWCDEECTTVGDLRRALSRRYPEAGTDLTADRSRAAIDDRFVTDDTALAGVDRVEFLPPVSGG